MIVLLTNLSHIEDSHSYVLIYRTYMRNLNFQKCAQYRYIFRTCHDMYGMILYGNYKSPWQIHSFKVFFSNSPSNFTLKHISTHLFT